MDRLHPLQEPESERVGRVDEPAERRSGGVALEGHDHEIAHRRGLQEGALAYAERLARRDILGAPGAVQLAHEPSPVLELAGRNGERHSHECHLTPPIGGTQGLGDPTQSIKLCEPRRRPDLGLASTRARHPTERGSSRHARLRIGAVAMAESGGRSLERSGMARGPNGCMIGL